MTECEFKVSNVYKGTNLVLKNRWYLFSVVNHQDNFQKGIWYMNFTTAERQGRQKKRREDNIKEWKGLELAQSQRAVENREKWRKLVVKSSSSLPQQHPQFRDR